MLGEQFKLLFMLYARPLKAGGRIIDVGRLGFAVAAALVVALVLAPTASNVRIVMAPTIVGQGAISQPVVQQPPTADEDQPRPTQRIPRQITPEERWRLTLISLLAPSPFIMLAAVALVFVPAVLLVLVLVLSLGGFSVILRRDYAALLSCTLMSWAAAYLPVAIAGLVLAPEIVRIPQLGPALFIAGLAYFLILTSCCVRTLFGSSIIAAAGGSVAGCAAAAGGLVIYSAVGSVGYYFASPWMLYFLYILFWSDVRSVGEGIRSRQHLRRQLEIATTNPRDADAHYQLGLIYQQRRQLTEATMRFERAIEIDPTEAEPFLQLGRIERERGDYDKAIEHLRKAASLNDKVGSSEVWRELGAGYFQSNRLQEAGEALEFYTARRSYDPEGLYWYGKALHALGKETQAREAFENCVEAVRTMPPHRRRQLRRWGTLAETELRANRKQAQDALPGRTS